MMATTTYIQHPPISPPSHVRHSSPPEEHEYRRLFNGLDGIQPIADVRASISSNTSVFALSSVILKPGPSRMVMYTPDRLRLGVMFSFATKVQNLTTVEGAVT